MTSELQIAQKKLWDAESALTDNDPSTMESQESTLALQNLVFERRKEVLRLLKEDDSKFTSAT